jgi:hypothetical protein
MNTKVINFPNIGFLKIDLTDEQMFPILEEIEEIRNNFLSAKKANYGLVGNIKKEFDIIKNRDYIEDLLKPYVQEFENTFHYLINHKSLHKSVPLGLLHSWVNFQEKHEFNPVHDHNGVFSFVIWAKIPYNIKDEIEKSPGSNSPTPLSGHFAFYYTDCLGKMSHYSIPADKSMENSLLIFPASLNHAVYPFYSSNDYRISISGNIGFQV